MSPPKPQQPGENMRRTAHSKIQTAAGSSIQDRAEVTTDAGGGGNAYLQSTAIGSQGSGHADARDITDFVGSSGYTSPRNHGAKSSVIRPNGGTNNKMAVGNNRTGQFSQVSSVARYNTLHSGGGDTSVNQGDAHMLSPPQQRLKNDVKTLSFIKGQSPDSHILDR